MFENPEIDFDALPNVDEVQWRSMDPKLIRYHVTGMAITLAIVAAGIGVFQGVVGGIFGADISVGYLWALLPVIAVPGFAWPFLSVPRMGYALREHDILYKSGVFWRTVTAVPFNRIQHVEKSSTPLDRRFQIASLQIFTAGGSGGDLKIHGLPSRVAEQIRSFILDKVGASIEED